MVVWKHLLKKNKHEHSLLYNVSPVVLSGENTMRDKALLIKNFNWRMLLMRILVNMLALLVTVLIVPNVYFVDRSLSAWIVMAVGLGVLNALIKPIIQFLTLRFIFITVGLVLIIINSIILYMLAWLLPNQFAVASLLWAIVAGAVLGLSSAFLENLLGLTPPIVSDKYPEIRQRVKDRQFYKVQAELSRIESRSAGTSRELAAAKAIVVDANPAVYELMKPHDQIKPKKWIQPDAVIRSGPEITELHPPFSQGEEQPLERHEVNSALPESDVVPAESGVSSPTDQIKKYGYSLDYIEGIGPSYMAKLQNCGVTTILDLLERGATRMDRDALAEQSGISSTLILKWVNYADLMRIRGIGSEYASLLEAAGIDTVIELAQRNPEHLYEKILAVNNEKNLVRRPPLRSQVDDWISQARELPRMITY